MEVSWYMQEKKKVKNIQRGSDANRFTIMHESLRMFFIYFHLLFIFIG